MALYLASSVCCTAAATTTTTTTTTATATTTISIGRGASGLSTLRAIAAVCTHFGVKLTL